MKNLKHFYLIIIIGISLFGCEEDLTTPTGNASNSSGSQIALISTFAGGEDDLWVMGLLLADPLPSYDYFKAGNSYLYTHDFGPGYVFFGNDDYNLLPSAATDPLSVEVKTSLGTLSGNLARPDSIQSITLSEYDTLALGQPFTVSWTGGSNADYIYVHVDYDWIDEQDEWHSVDPDTFVTGNSVTFPGSIFSYNGEIDYIYVTTLNGPAVEPGARGNMTGSGSGYFHYNGGSLDISENIQVGSGHPLTAGTPPDDELNSSQRRRALSKKIAAMYGFPNWD